MDILAEYAAAHGLRYREVSMALPKATQLMRHGFMQEVKGMASGVRSSSRRLKSPASDDAGVGSLA